MDYDSEFLQRVGLVLNYQFKAIHISRELYIAAVRERLKESSGLVEERLRQLFAQSEADFRAMIASTVQEALADPALVDACQKKLLDMFEDWKGKFLAQVLDILCTGLAADARMSKLDIEVTPKH